MWGCPREPKVVLGKAENTGLQWAVEKQVLSLTPHLFRQTLILTLGKWTVHIESLPLIRTGFCRLGSSSAGQLCVLHAGTMILSSLQNIASVGSLSTGLGVPANTTEN